VGRGWSVPANLIEPAAAATVNELAAKLGYIRVDDTWGVADTPPDFRVLAPGAWAGGTPAADDGATGRCRVRSC